jgi:hypothetical protein
MEYMIKVECWSISIDRSYRPESDIQLLRFELSGGCLILIDYIIIIYQKDGQSNRFFDSIEA